MVVIKEVSAKTINNSRNEKTILVEIKTSNGKFFASAPSGKSTGTYEAKPYIKNLNDEIKTLKKFSDYFSEENIGSFEDLKRIDDVLKGFVGANTLFALQSAALKALAHREKKEIWELIKNENSTMKFPRLVGNCIGGGKHNSKAGKKPDFQEFVIIPEENSVKDNLILSERIKKNLRTYLEEKDEKFQELKNDEDAWVTSLNEKEVFEILKNQGVPIGTDIAASTFYKRKKYNYENPMLKRDSEEQLSYLCNLIKNFNLFYIEDPFNEEDFSSFSKLLKKFPDRLIVGDDLTTTNVNRLKKAIEMESINAVIVKPNQTGSLIEVMEVCNLARKNKIKIVFSHRSGETNEDILADLAFGFQADFFKSGITGKEREVKINRLIEIEKSLSKSLLRVKSVK